MPVATTSYGRTNTLNDDTSSGYSDTGGYGGGTPAPSGPAPASDSAKQAAYAKLRAAYRNVFGPNRQVTDEELESHLAGRYDDATVRRAVATIVQSEEGLNYFSSEAKNYTGGQASKDYAYKQVRAAYQKYLGRTPSPDEIESHLSGVYDPVAVQQAVVMIQNSAEAEAYTAGGGQGAPAAGEGGATREDRDKLQWGQAGRMMGFNMGDYGGNLKARNSVKNTFGRIASRFPNTPEGLRNLLQDPEFKKYFPQATLVSGGAGDKINFGGVKSDFEEGVPVYEVDVLVNSNPDTNTADGWAWQPTGAQGAGQTPPPPPPTTPPSSAQNRPTGGGDVSRTPMPAGPGQGFYDYLIAEQRRRYGGVEPPYI